MACASVHRSGLGLQAHRHSGQGIFTPKSFVLKRVSVCLTSFDHQSKSNWSPEFSVTHRSYIRARVGDALLIS